MFLQADCSSQKDLALHHPGLVVGDLHIAGVLKLDDHCGPFQPRSFYDSMILDWILDIIHLQ